MTRMRFRTDLLDTLIGKLKRTRRLEGSEQPPHYEILSPPHDDSPFLTLSESAQHRRARPAQYVLKILVVPQEDGSFKGWQAVLEREHQRWLDELESRSQPSEKVEPLALPLTHAPRKEEPLVTLEQLGPFRPRLLVEPSAHRLSNPRVWFPYLRRPYIPWPRLRDIGYSEQKVQRLWDEYCKKEELGEEYRRKLFDHFRDEALIDSHDDVLLTTRWRLEGLRVRGEKR